MSATFQSAFQKEDQSATIISQKIHYLLLSINCVFAKLLGKGTVGVGLLFVAPYHDKGHHDVVIVRALHEDHLEVPDPGRLHEHSLQPPFLRRGLLLLVHQPVTKPHQVGVARHYLPHSIHLQGMLLPPDVLSKILLILTQYSEISS